MIKYTLCDLIAPPEVIKKYVTKNKEPMNDSNKSEWAPYYFDLNKIIKSNQKLQKRTAKVNSNMRIWGTHENVIKSGYVPGSDSVSFWCNHQCPDIAIKKIFDDNPGVDIRFYWFDEKDDKEHYYIRDMKLGKILIKNGKGKLKARKSADMRGES